MIDRRLFLGSSAALGALGALGVTGWSPASHASSATIFFDGHTADGQRFAELTRAHGLAPQDTGRDLASLLYGPLRGDLADPAASMVGVTRYADFTVASGIAREKGLQQLLPGKATSELANLLQQAAAQPIEPDMHFWIFVRA